MLLFYKSDCLRKHGANHKLLTSRAFCFTCIFTSWCPFWCTFLYNQLPSWACCCSKAPAISNLPIIIVLFDVLLFSSHCLFDVPFHSQVPVRLAIVYANCRLKLKSAVLHCYPLGPRALSHKLNSVHQKSKRMQQWNYTQVDTLLFSQTSCLPRQMPFLILQAGAFLESCPYQAK